jgi:hypothetical protein
MKKSQRSPFIWIIAGVLVIIGAVVLVPNLPGLIQKTPTPTVGVVADDILIATSTRFVFPATWTVEAGPTNPPQPTLTRLASQTPFKIYYRTRVITLTVTASLTPGPTQTGKPTSTRSPATATHPAPTSTLSGAVPSAIPPTAVIPTSVPPTSIPPTETSTTAP